MRQLNAAPQQDRVCAAPLQAFSRAYTPVRKGFGPVTLVSGRRSCAVIRYFAKKTNTLLEGAERCTLWLRSSCG